MKRNISKDESGAVAMIFGLAAVPVLLMAGGAIDYSVAAKARTALQRSVDQAALAGVGKTGSEVSAAQAAFNGEVSNAGLGNATSTWEMKNGQLVGNASTDVSTSFMGLLGKPTLTVLASATAQPRSVPTPTNVTVSVNFAKGWSWKRLTIFRQQTASSTPEAMATYIYQPTDRVSQKAIGLGDTTGPLGEAVQLGTNYSGLYLQLEVYTDGCGPGKIPTSNSNNPFSCKNGTKSSSTKYYVFKTNDPATSKQLFTSNQKVEKTIIDTIVATGKTPTGIFKQLLSTDIDAITTIFQCGKTITHAWEDSLAAGDFATQDIFFDVNTPSCAANTSYMSSTRLVR